MKPIIISASLFFGVIFVQAQQISVGEMARTARFSKVIDEINNGEAVLKYSDIQGDPFYKSGFSKAKVGDAENILSVRYNMYKDAFEVLNDSDIYAIPRNNAFSKITFIPSNETFILLNDDAGVAGYFLLLAEGRNTLLKKMAVSYSPEMPAPNTMIAGSPARFDLQKPIYFIKTEDNFIKITKKAEDLINALPADKKDVAKDFIKTNKIKMNEEADLIKLVTFLNK
ncbi:hypothetical protein [Chryseobacterium sp. SC28]|uniref:hypothetical protein n=1 Tax=Chryseobacterium sp. SC28 TaxID=2268028 RepID=UPI000F652D68|nr:hypothetical protein [Chryseobacterium sp. SC28]RRQ47151.1 hypothetical protein DTW91_00225 [Chryseobacterium sp. SC28]